jgi:hypothetical protein
VDVGRRRSSRRFLDQIVGRVFGTRRDRARTAAADYDHDLTKPVEPKLLQTLMRTARAVRG